jgi:lipoyl(octanoyl) transferase
MEKQRVEVRDLGLMEYKAAWDYQDALMQENLAVKKQEISNSQLPMINDQPQIPNSKCQISNAELPTPNSKLETSNYLLFVEHPPVYTLGKSGKMENVLIDEDQRKEQGIDFYHTNRGGDITFHGPGQIVAYPILDLEKFYTDIGRYLRELEEVVILTLAEYGIIGGRSAGETGVWVDAAIRGKERKICAMGVRCSRWITMHGLALNVNNDLGYFNNIIPCGIADKKVTSVKNELGSEVPLEEVKEKLKSNFEKVFNASLFESPQNSLVR